MRRSKKKSRFDKCYGWGLALLILGAGGMADAIQGQGSIMIAATIFAVGFGLICASYIR